MEFAKYFDHTLLKQDATSEGIDKLCKEAKQYGFMSVCVNPDYVARAKSNLEGSDVKVCTVIGFPLGANKTSIKVEEIIEAIKDGATELDMVINVSKAKEGKFDEIEEEIAALKKACDGKLLKVILETCLLTDEEIKQCCLAAKRAKADYVKTSTGFSKGGATAHHVKLMRDTVGSEMGVKASGGIHTKAEAMEMIEAGASRIGCSASVAIMNEK